MQQYFVRCGKRSVAVFNKLCGLAMIGIPGAVHPKPIHLVAIGRSISGTLSVSITRCSKPSLAWYSCFRCSARLAALVVRRLMPRHDQNGDIQEIIEVAVTIASNVALHFDIEMGCRSSTLSALFIIALWRSRRHVTAGLALMVWIVCAMFAVTAAVGLAAQVRTAMVGKRDGTIAEYRAVERDLAEAERQRDSRVHVRTTREIESNVAEVLARSAGRRGTIKSLSNACARDVGRTRDACAQVAALRVELATALERDLFDARVHVLRREVARLRQHGGAAEADPQAQLLVRLSNGFVGAGDVALLLILLLVAMVELISAFAPLVIQEYVAVHAGRRVAAGRASSGAVAARRGRSSEVGKSGSQPHRRRQILAYLAERIRPDAAGRVTAGRLFADFAMWTVDAGSKPIKREVFLAVLDEIAQADMHGKVIRHGDVYHGLTLDDATAEAAA